MEKISLENELKSNSYPGRGIIIGTSPDGKSAVCAYFIMGRSENSRNRVFVRDGETLKTEPFDASKVSDPSLIIYNAVRKSENNLIVTNGDQTDTVYNLMSEGKSFKESLETREFEPDAPNFTPRISGILYFENGFNYEMNIRKKLGYPPYYYICNILISSTSFEQASEESKKIKKFIDNKLDDSYIVLGPSVSSIVKLKNKYRFNIMIKYKKNELLYKALEELNKLEIKNVTIDISINI